MTVQPWMSVALFSVVIVLGAVGGAAIPAFTGKDRKRITLLAFAAGVMLGAAFFHMLPEALHGGGVVIFSWAIGGFALMFLLERYALTHACEEPPDCEEHAGHGKSLGIAAFIGLAVHTLFDGVALGSATAEGVGMMAFVAIVAHKVPSSLSLASILVHEGRRARTVLLAGAAYGLMVPVGAALYFGFDRALQFEGFTAGMLAFSSGTFLYIAVSDLLPHVNRHKEGRRLNALAMVAGLALMFLLTFVTSHEHEPVAAEATEATEAAAVAAPAAP